MAIEVVKIREFKGHTQAVYAIAVEPDKACIYSGSGDGMIVRWRMNEPDGHLFSKMDGAIFSLSLNKAYLISGTQLGVLSIFNASGELIKHIKISNTPIFDILINEQSIIVLSGDGFLRVFSNTFHKIQELSLSSKSLRTVVKIDDGFAVSGSEGKIYILDSSFKLIRELSTVGDSIFSLIYNQKNSLLISGGKDAQINMYQNNKIKKSIAAHLLHVHSLALNHDGKLFLSSSMDKTIKLWDTESADLLKVINFEKHQSHTSSVNKILWFDKNNFISCSDDRTLMCFEFKNK